MNTNQSPKISVIVPIYNVERYIRQCLDSIVSQSLKDLEILLIDDGSTDNSGKIADEFAKKDKRCIVIHNKNCGYGASINLGIKMAKGEYVGIIESDDWIAPNMYEKLYMNAIVNNSDIVKCNFFIYNSYLPRGKQNSLWENKKQNLTDAPVGAFSILEYPKLFIFHASIWAGIYKSEFIKTKFLVESESASYQDFPFMCEVYCRAKRISIVREPLVHYRMEFNQNSSTIRTDKRLIWMPKQCIEGKNILKKYGMLEKLKEEFFYHSFLACNFFFKTIQIKYKKDFLSALMDLFADVKNDNLFSFKYFSKKERRNFIHQMKGDFIWFLLKDTFIIRNTFDRRFKFIRIFGLNFMVKKFYIK